VRALRLLALRRLRLQPLRALLAALVVGGGASLVVTILVVSASLQSSVVEAGRALAGPAPLRVLGPVQRGGLSEGVVAEVARVDGVRAVVPLIQAISEVDPDGARGTRAAIAVSVLGFDCRVTAILPQLDRDQCSDEALAQLPAPLLGQQLAEELEGTAELRTNVGRLPLDRRAALEGLDTINAGRVVALPMAQAQAQLGRGDGVDLAYVLPDEGTSVPELAARIERALPADHRVLSSDDAPPIIGVVLGTFLPLFAVVALLTLGIGAVLVRNSITLSLEERRRQTAIVGALGGGRGLLVGGTLLEVVVLGGVGGVLGDLFGVALAHPVSGGLSDITRKLAGIPVEIRVPPLAMAAGVLLGLGVSVLSAIGPARRAVRIDVAAELASRSRREEAAKAVSPWRLVGCAVVVATGMALATATGSRGGVDRWQTTLAPVGFLMCTVGGVGGVAISVGLLLGVLERRGRFRRASLRLAVSNLRREPRRSGVMAIALGFAMGVGFVTASFNDSVTEAIRTQLDRRFEGVQVAATDPNNSATSEVRLSPAVLEALEALPGVRTVDRSSVVVVGNEEGRLIGVRGFTDPWVDDGRFDARGRTTRAGLDAGQAAIGPGLARQQGLRPGDLLRLPTPHGPVQVPIMSIVYDGDFGGRNVALSYELVRRLYGPQAPVSVVVKGERGVSDAELLERIRAARLDRGLLVEGREEVLARNAKAIRDQLSTLDAIQRGLLVMSFVAVLSSLLLVGIQRQRELGMLAAVGMTPHELRRMVLWEAALVAVLGVLATGVAASAQYWALNAIVPVIIGYRDPLVIDPGSFVVYSLIAVATAVLAALYPARRAGQVEVLDALRYE
jgi:putative ABC transport system permease protein